MLQVSLDENRAMPIPGYRLRKATLHQGVDRRAQFLFSLADRHSKQREFSGPRLRFVRLINATGKPSASKAKEWSRCLAVQVVRKRRRWEACLSETGDRNSRAIFRRCCGSVVSGPNHRKAKLPRFPANTGHDRRRACEHFKHRELAENDVWRSHSTRRSYVFYFEQVDHSPVERL